MRNVYTSTFPRRHLPRRLHHECSSCRSPVNVLWITLREEVDELTPENQGGRSRIVGCWKEVIWVIGWRVRDFSGLGTSTMSGIVMNGGHEVFGRESGVVDSYDPKVGSG